jgi:hypothetical protein
MDGDSEEDPGSGLKEIGAKPTAPGRADLLSQVTKLSPSGVLSPSRRTTTTA